MCVVSMVGDHYTEKWRKAPWMPTVQPWEVCPTDRPAAPSYPNKTVEFVSVSKEEFDALRKEVEEMKELLKRAKEYDERNNEPDCEVDEKMELLRRVAAAVGISLDDVIGSKS